MTPCKRLLLIALILTVCVGCDQITKLAARRYLEFAPPRSFPGDIFRLQYAENTGVFLSLGSGLPAGTRFWVFTIFTGTILMGLLFYILIQGSLSPAYVTGYSLFIAGGIGNLIDRIFNNGIVVDFMNIGIGNLRTGIFNIADAAIMAGAAILVFLAFYHRKAEGPKKALF